jgi:dipeptidase E
MKLILTSAGIANPSIENELKRLVGKDFNGLRLLFCPTASNYEGGGMNTWLIKDLLKLRDLGFEVDVCDINGVPKEIFLPRFETADVLFFEGGNSQWLRKCIKDSGLEPELPNLLKTRLWVGASAGSIVLCPTVLNGVQELFDEQIKNLPADGLGLVDFQFVPHFNNPHFPKIRQQNLQHAAKNLAKIDGKKLYIMDDNSAISVNSSDQKIISEGRWLEI